MSFQLHPRLAASSFDFGTQGMCRILLKDNALFPWFILVPEVDTHITELHQLKAHDYSSVMDTIRQMSEFVETQYTPDKLNIGAIGNIVPQLHIHLISRFKSDPAWPGTVWSHSSKKPYTEETMLATRNHFRQVFTPTQG